MDKSVDKRWSMNKSKILDKNKNRSGIKSKRKRRAREDQDKG